MVMTSFMCQLPRPTASRVEQGGHNLGDAGGVTLLVCRLLVEDLLGVHIDEQGGLGVDGQGGDPLVLYGPCQGSQQPGEQ